MDSHPWFNVFSAHLSSVTSVQRLTTLLATLITECAIVCILFGGPNSETATPSLLRDLAVGIWSALLCAVPIFLFSVLFRKTGPRLVAAAYCTREGAEVEMAAHLARKHRLTDMFLPVSTNKNWVAYLILSLI